MGLAGPLDPCSSNFLSKSASRRATIRADRAPGELPDDVPLAELKRGGEPRRGALLRMALLNHGVDLLRGKSAFVSAVHSEADIDTTVAALDAALIDVENESVQN